jgi:HK97 gp10 family phage protein
MADSGVTLTGLEEAIAALKARPDKLRKRALKNALSAGARLVRDEARKNAPVIGSGDPMVQKGYRKPKTLRNAILVRTSKAARRQGNVGVFVNVRPARNAVIRGGKVIRAKEKGAKNPLDPFYWRFLEFGRSARAASGPRARVARDKKRGIKGVRSRRALRAVGAIAPMRFLQRAAGKLGEALEAFKRSLGPQLAKLNQNPKSDL